MRRLATQLVNWIIGIVDRCVPKGSSVVIRTFPDFDDQCRAVGEALHEQGLEIVVLADDVRAPNPPLTFPCRVVPARSIRAAIAFWRSGTVIHTHGVYGNIRGAKRRRFVNVWHGMPIKLLPAGSPVGRNQTDVTVATSTVHAAHLAATWELDEEQVAIVGLPRNDRLVTTSRDPGRLARSGVDRPLILWMPTYRATADGSEIDGVDRGSITQFAGAHLPDLDALMALTGHHLVIKPHPLAPPPDDVELEHVSVWNEQDLWEHGWTLYELLANTDLLITDVSSVWIDFLVLDRPIVFAMSDAEEYANSRGTYFEELDDLFPGERCRNFDELLQAIAVHADGGDPHRERRQAARAFHHQVEPGVAASAVAMIVGRP